MRLVRRILRGLRQSPRLVARRVAYELAAEAERFLAPRRYRLFDEAALLRATAAADLDSLWQQLAQGPYPTLTAAVNTTEIEELCPGDRGRILTAAEDALAFRVKLLGPEVHELGPRIAWSRDYKAGVTWPGGYMRDIVCVDPEDPSDVKVPWELSRLQWLIPAGQAYRLSGDERYARAVRAVLDDWIAANPYAQGVNWACTMEAALRILSWTWFFRIFHASPSWADREFRGRLLTALYLHGDFTERHLELSDVNGNHCTADAAGLVFAGLFFRGRDAERWQERGWSLLCAELPRQVFADGVDFEGSVAYHRLVLELFFLPALYRQACGLPVPDAYRARVIEMARFAAAYSRPNGTVPLWGDADDARALPLGGQGLNDHRYLAGLVGAAWDVADLRESFAGPRSEVLWVLGPEALRKLPDTASPSQAPRSRAFPEGGFYVLRNESDHIFIDCGPVGLAGRGGHGHNDCLSFEAVLDGVSLVSDCGAFVYTASFEERNRFRATAAHNTPRVDGKEINRFEPEWLWNLEYDARPEVRTFLTNGRADVFCGAHAGYRRLDPPVTPVRRIVLEHDVHRLRIEDSFEGAGQHHVEIPLHLAPGVRVSNKGDGFLVLQAEERTFRLAWDPVLEWSLEIGSGRVSPSYGVAVSVVRLTWTRAGTLGVPLCVQIEPLANESVCARGENSDSRVSRAQG